MSSDVFGGAMISFVYSSSSPLLGWRYWVVETSHIVATVAVAATPLGTEQHEIQLNEFYNCL